MEIKFFIDTKQKVIIEAFRGEISLATIGKAIPYIWNHPDYSPKFDGIIDFRQSKLLFSKNELHDLMKTIAEDDKGLKGRAAILVSEPIAAAMATIYGEQMKDYHSVGIFCAESEVIHFLRIDPAIFNKLNDPKAVIVDLH